MHFQKIADEGTSSPFIARMMLGVNEFGRKTIEYLHLENGDEAIQQFFAVYQPIYNNLSAARTAAKALSSEVSTHIVKTERGENILESHNSFQVTETVHDTIRDNFHKVLVQLVIATKAAQRIPALFGLDIGFLFQKDSGFDSGITRLRKDGHILLADYLIEVRRLWSQDLLARRAAHEHEGWNLANGTYSRTTRGNVTFLVPIVDGLPAPMYAARMANNVISFIENLAVYTFQTALYHTQFPWTFIEEPGRNAGIASRFVMTIRQPNTIDWKLKYVVSDFI